MTIRSADNLANVKKTLNDPKEWIQAMAFSPDGSKLAVGSHDNRVYIYDVGSYNRVATCSGHSSFITGLDWSTDSTCLHTVCGAYELLFWDASNGSQKTSGATELRNEEWSTWSTILGWPVQGIFGGIIDYTHVNSVDRSPDKSHLIVGNDYGFVEVFRYPNGEGAQSDAYRAHSEHVTNVKYRPDASYIFSAGGYDQTVMQWKRV